MKEKLPEIIVAVISWRLDVLYTQLHHVWTKNLQQKAKKKLLLLKNFDRPEMDNDRAKYDLTGHHDRPPPRVISSPEMVIK